MHKPNFVHVLLFSTASKNFYWVSDSFKLLPLIFIPFFGRLYIKILKIKDFDNPHVMDTVIESRYTKVEELA